MKSIFLSKLLKLELRAFAEEVIRIVSQHDTKTLHIDGTFQALIDQRPNIELLIVPYGSHPLTVQKEYMNEKCLNYAAIITNQIGVYSRLEDEETNRLVKIAQPAIHFYLNRLRQNNLTYIHGMLYGLFVYLKEKPIEKEALVSLGLEGYLNKLQDAHIAYKKVTGERLASKSKRPKIDSKAIQREIQHLLRMLFNQIDYYQHAYQDLNYRPMINELNGVISEFSGSINSRAAVNKRKAIKTKEIKKAKEDAASATQVNANATLQDVNEPKVNPQTVDNGKPDENNKLEEKGDEVEKPQQGTLNKNIKDEPTKSPINKKKPKGGSSKIS